VLQRFGQFADELTSRFGRGVQRHAASQYLEGLFNDSEGKSMQAMHRRLSDAGTYQALQHFITDSPWDAQRVWARVRALIPECRGTLAVDDRFIMAGAKFSTGTDTNSFLNFQQGDPMANEMMSMVEMGMSPVDVIVASTRSGAETLGLVKDLCTVEKGKLADVIVVAGNPLEHMDAMKHVAYVVTGGVRYK
jgi:imidazolonepropionase-like amidohydrolase